MTVCRGSSAICLFSSVFLLCSLFFFLPLKTHSDLSADFKFPIGLVIGYRMLPCYTLLRLWIHKRRRWVRRRRAIQIQLIFISVWSIFLCCWKWVVTNVHKMFFFFFCISNWQNSNPANSWTSLLNVKDFFFAYIKNCTTWVMPAIFLCHVALHITCNRAFSSLLIVILIMPPVLTKCWWYVATVSFDHDKLF